MPELFQLDYVHFVCSSQYDTKIYNSEYIKWSFSISYFEKYVN